MQGAKSKLDLFLSGSHQLSSTLNPIRALQESSWSLSWILQSIKQYSPHSTFRSNILFKPRRPSVFLAVIQGHIMQAYYIIFVIFFSWDYILWPTHNFWKHLPTSIRIHIHHPCLHSAGPRADRHYEQKSDGQLSRAVVQYLIWPCIHCSALQFIVHSLNSKGKLRRAMSRKLCSVLVAMKNSLSNTLKGNCNIWRVISFLNVYWTKYCWI